MAERYFGDVSKKNLSFPCLVHNCCMLCCIHGRHYIFVFGCIHFVMFININTPRILPCVAGTYPGLLQYDPVASFSMPCSVLLQMPASLCYVRAMESEGVHLCM